MAIFKCKMCGGDLEVNEKMTVGTCEYCGSTMTLPKDTDDKKANLFNRANHFRRNNDFDKALLAYENILNEDNTDAEAHWGVVLCKYGIEYVEDPKTRERVPTCHRTQYESIFIDPDYKQAIANADSSARSIYEAEAKKIDAIQKGILEISSKEEPFDVFICYKETDEAGSRTKDSVIAQDIYYHLKEEGFKVFFSRITLEDKLGSAYEPYIFAALHSSKVMVVVGTKLEHFSSTWTKNEWSRFLALIKNGEKKLLIPAYRDMDPYDLPEEFSHLQAQDMGKIGFVQDLVRGIKKVVSNGEQKAATAQAPISQGNATTKSLLDRAYLCLETGDFSKADNLTEQVLNIDPRSASAYIVKLMVELKINQVSDLAQHSLPLDSNTNYLMAVRFAEDKYRQTIEGYNQVILDRLETERKEKIYQTTKHQIKFGTVKNEREYKAIAESFRSISGYKDADALASECDQLAEQERIAQEQKHEAARLKQLRAEEEARIKAEEDRLREEQRLLEVERQKQIAAAKLKKQIRLASIVVPIVALVITGLVLLNIYVLVPASKYNKAQELLAEKQYAKAISIFKELGDYRDIADQTVDKYKVQILENTRVGDMVYWGQYEQDNNSANGKEDIAWKVLAISEGKALLISEKNLDCQPYHTRGESVTWATCTLRRWLNTTFLSEAFTAEDQSRIVETDLINSDNPNDGTRGGYPTKDTIFLLSITEVNKYFPDDRARVGANTAYAVSRGASDNGGNGWWWLRSTGRSDDVAASVFSDGDVDEDGISVSNGIDAVRPAFWINLKS